MERPKTAIFGCFRLIMGLFLIDHEDFGTETCTKPVGILGEAFYVVLGPRFVSFRYGKAKKAIFGCFRPIMGLFFIEYEDFGTETCTKPVGILCEAFYVSLNLCAATCPQDFFFLQETS